MSGLDSPATYIFTLKDKSTCRFRLLPSGAMRDVEVKEAKSDEMIPFMNRLYEKEAQIKLTVEMPSLFDQLPKSQCELSYSPDAKRDAQEFIGKRVKDDLERRRS